MWNYLINSLNHETYREIHLEQDEELTQHWGAVKPTDLLGRCGMFHGIYQHYEMGLTKKKLRFNINQSSKIAHTHPTQMCFPSLAFSFKKPWVPPPCFRTPEPWQWASSPKQWAHSRASQAGFCLEKNVYVYIYTHTFVWFFIHLLTYCCILICIINYYYMCISFIESMVKSRILFTTHEITICLENWHISRSKLRNHCNDAQGHPANHHLQRGRALLSAGPDGEKNMKRSKEFKRSKNMKLQNPSNYWRYHLAQSFNGDFWNNHDRTLRQLVTSGISI